MQVLTTTSGWQSIPDDRSSTYRTTQLYVKAMMTATAEMSPNQVSLHKASFVDHNKVVLHILRMERHRAYTVAYCLQENPKTGGIRYIAYGMETNPDCDYGIGTSLSDITTESSAEYCPREITARHVEG